MKTVVITGSTRGLGFELAKKFKENDYNVVICGTREETVNNALAKFESVAGNGKVVGTTCNVTVLSDVEALADFAVKEFGMVDIWINNAGVNQSNKPAWEIDDKEIDSLLSIDLKGAINGSNVAVRTMKEKGGAIYNVEGMGSTDEFQPGFALYGTTKRAVTYFTDALAKEVKYNNLPIIVGKLSPGIMITDFLTKNGAMELSEKHKKVYNILGDYPDVIADFLVKHMLTNTKNGKRITWLTSAKASYRFMTAGFSKRDFFN